MLPRFLCAAALSLSLPLAATAAEQGRGLAVYFVDTEGGAATLIVTPAGESVLIDCGNPGPRDAERIHRAAKLAGIEAIDHLVITHWHSDHYGGVGRLTQLLSVRHFYDRGIPDTLAEDPRNFPTLIRAYKTATAGKSRTLRPGDEIKLKATEGAPALRLLCLCGGGAVLPDKPGAPENPIAKEHKPQPVDTSDNAKSLGFLLRYGDFRFLDLGDLTWNVEYKLVHPTDKVGPVDVFQSTHHGLDISNNTVLLKTVRPRVVVFNNGARKGCDPSVTAALRRIPDVRAIYQMHRNLKVGPQENTEAAFIANAAEKCQGELIRLAVAPDSKSYTVAVGKEGKPRRYPTRGAGE
ncbi:MAG TPA: MBL fold metallo-hydrolase [Gemmataceae bacterium]|jgi:beta-lactamase superfamily II metal-dependent hydrolase|nr:MBL fold metallo-hydrolase [Gemmataceae bacterium]